MPVCALHLLALKVPLKTFLTTLSSSDLQALVVSKVVRWIIRPEHISVDPLLTQSPPWDVLLILSTSETGLPRSLAPLVTASYTLTVGVPSRITSNFATTNSNLLHPLPGTVPPLTGSLDDNPNLASDSQSLQLSPDLQSFVSTFGKTREGQSAVSMLNLLTFKPNQKASYLKYGAAFAESIGSRRGGVAKIVGNVLGGNTEDAKQWHEIALAHYPSIWHFADMLAGKDYQEVNQKYRAGSLTDTCILCTTEVGLEEELRGTAKL